MEEVARFQGKALEHPVGEVDFAFFGYEFQHAGVGLCVFCAVDELEEHGIGDVQAGELVESAGGHDDFAAVIDVLTFGAGEHGDGVTTVVFVEATRGPSCSRSECA